MGGCDDCRHVYLPDYLYGHGGWVRGICAIAVPHDGIYSLCPLAFSQYDTGKNFAALSAEPGRIIDHLCHDVDRGCDTAMGLLCWRLLPIWLRPKTSGQISF
jgi:hypothetical protein